MKYREVYFYIYETREPFLHYPDMNELCGVDVDVLLCFKQACLPAVTKYIPAFG